MSDTNPSTLPARSAASPELPVEVIDRLFERLHAMYGARWLDLWSGADKDRMQRIKATWAQELADVTPKAMKHALDALDSAFPPSLPEFRSLCRQFRPREISNVTLLTAPRQKVPVGTFQRLQDIVNSKREEGA